MKISIVSSLISFAFSCILYATLCIKYNNVQAAAVLYNRPAKFVLKANPRIYTGPSFVLLTICAGSSVLLWANIQLCMCMLIVCRISLDFVKTLFLKTILYFQVIKFSMLVHWCDENTTSIWHMPTRVGNIRNYFPLKPYFTCTASAINQLECTQCM